MSWRFCKLTKPFSPNRITPVPLNRYSADLDFWFAKPTAQDLYFDRFKREVGDHYEITDAKMKHFALLFELRKGIALPAMNPTRISAFRKKIQGLKSADFKVKLGSILENDARAYYINREFALLKEKLDETHTAEPSH